MIYLLENQINNKEQPYSSKKKLLVISIFKNSVLWIDDILKCMKNFYQFNEEKCDEKYRLDLNFSFIDGQSSDGTFEILENYATKGNLDIQLRQFEPNIDNDGTDEYIRFKILATVRNYIVRQSTDQSHLDDDDYLLFADSDIKFGERVIHNLIRDMENYKADVIAPLIYIEDFREFENAYFYDILAFRDIYGFRFSHVMQLNDIDMEIPNEVSSVGSFYIMKYKVAKSVKYTGNHDSEQAEFCENARSKGFKIFVSPKLSVLHVNLDKYGLEWH